MSGSRLPVIDNGAVRVSDVGEKMSLREMRQMRYWWAVFRLGRKKLLAMQPLCQCGQVAVLIEHCHQCMHIRFTACASCNGDMKVLDSGGKLVRNWWKEDMLRSLMCCSV